MGGSGGIEADSFGINDHRGLPYLPANTIRGLFKHAAETLQKNGQTGIDEEFIKHVFGGYERNEGDEKKQITLMTGYSFFTNVTLNKDEAGTLLATQYLLQRIEYSPPCTLYGQILNVEEKYQSQLKDCAAFIKGIGSNRIRGYGRCEILFL